MAKFTQRSPGATEATTNRTVIEPAWPMGGVVTKPMADRSWSVQQLTGYPTSNYLPGQFTRGKLIRMHQPALNMPEWLPMYDPSGMQQYGNNAYYYRTFS
jgi:hypothetical protein